MEADEFERIAEQGRVRVRAFPELVMVGTDPAQQRFPIFRHGIWIPRQVPLTRRIDDRRGQRVFQVVWAARPARGRRSQARIPAAWRVDALS